MIRNGSSMFRVLGAGAFVGVLAAGCQHGARDVATDDPTKPTTTYGTEAGTPDGSETDPTFIAQDAGITPAAGWAKDPPPQYCGPKPEAAPKPPGGTVECPDDKNREGCSCTTPGESAACWPGLRVNRSLGQCKDGKTTCVQKGELAMAWGPCVGAVLPSGTSGKAACTCFSSGSWHMDNATFCSGDDGNGGLIMISGEKDHSCSQTGTPVGPFSANTLKVDCAGHYKLCFTIKAGSSKAPNATDCTVGQSCVEVDYETSGAVQTLPDLPSWKSSNQTCMKSFEMTGGYGEMTVLGKSVACDDVSNQGKPIVFDRGAYCSPNDPSCVGSGPTGMF